MPIIDPAHLEELEDLGEYGVNTIRFVKKLAKGLMYVDLTGFEDVVEGILRTGDGENFAGESNLLVRGYAVVPPTIAISAGSVVTGGGTSVVWFNTDETGFFELTITGSGSTLLEICVPFGPTVLHMVNL